MKNLSLENINRKSKIKRRKHVIAIEVNNQYINQKLYIFNKHFRWVLLRCQCSKMVSLNCIIISINIHYYFRLKITFIYFFFLLKISVWFHSNKIKAVAQQLKLHLANLLDGRIKWMQFIYRFESDQLASEKLTLQSC